MKELRSRLTIISLICLFAVSVASCESTKPDSGNSTVVVTNTTEETDAPDESSKDDSSKDNSKDNNETTNTASTEAPVPEKDAEGSKISVVEVTDAQSKPVTKDGGAAVTELVIVDDKGAVITDSKGSNAKPVTEAVTTAADRIVATDPPSTNKPSGNVSPEVKKGPTLTIPKGIEAKAGEEFTFKIEVSDNPGFHGLIAWLDINEKYFDLVSFKSGDPDSSNYEDSDVYNYLEFTEHTKEGSKDLKTLIMMYFDMNCKQLTGDVTYATITLKVKEGTPAGEYDLAFDTVQDAGRAQCNTTETVDGKTIIVPLKNTYVNGSVIVK
ncbi:MAG: hypothetical protein E7505_09140 [Ruminococcus sp.]|nr:hypothetical protein [Ruminococcus sp.]